MFLSKVERDHQENINDKYEKLMNEKWSVIRNAILYDKVAEEKLDMPIDNSVMDTKEVGEKRAEARMNNDMKLVRLFEL